MHDNIDQWISEFPLHREFIIKNTKLFMALTPPRDKTIGDEQWRRVTLQLRQEIGD